MTLSLHPTYHDAHVRTQIAAAYKANALPSVQLQGFLEQTTYERLTKELAKVRLSPEVVADRYSRSVAKATKQLTMLFSDPAFSAFVKQITGKQLKGKPRIERYGWRDYTLRNDEQKPPGLLVYFDVTPGWNSKWGGATIISNSIGELARVQPVPNTLVLIDCSTAWPFVQYINHYAEKNAIIRVTFE